EGHRLGAVVGHAGDRDAPPARGVEVDRVNPHPVPDDAPARQPGQDLVGEPGPGAGQHHGRTGGDREDVGRGPALAADDPDPQGRERLLLDGEVLVAGAEDRHGRSAAHRHLLTGHARGKRLRTSSRLLARNCRAAVSAIVCDTVPLPARPHRGRSRAGAHGRADGVTGQSGAARARPTLVDVARSAGVHPSTASRALNPRTRGSVSPATVQAVLRTARRLGYQPNPVARGLKLRRTFTIGMLVPALTNPLFPPIVRGIEDRLRDSGFIVVLANTDNDDDKERSLLAAMTARRVDGLILATARREYPLLRRVTGAG